LYKFVDILDEHITSVFRVEEQTAQLNNQAVNLFLTLKVEVVFSSETCIFLSNCLCFTKILNKKQAAVCQG
jgi:hypothetical protein